MCQCGCGDYAGRWRIPGPDGKWYVIGLYQGCKSCDNPVGLSIDLFDKEDMSMWDAKDLPVIGGPDHPNFGIPLVNIDLLRVALFKTLDDHGVNTGEYEIERDDLADEMDLWAMMSGVAWDTVNEFDKERAK